MFRILNQKLGEAKLSDGTIIFLRVAIVDVRETGFSPFEGINFTVKPIGGITARSPLELKEKVKSRPLSVGPQPPKDGWETIDIIEQKPAMEEVIVQSSSGKEYLVKVEAELSMVSRNINYKNEFEEPIYWASWVNKFSWRRYESEKSKGGE